MSETDISSPSSDAAIFPEETNTSIEASSENPTEIQESTDSED